MSPRRWSCWPRPSRPGRRRPPAAEEPVGLVDELVHRVTVSGEAGAVGLLLKGHDPNLRHKPTRVLERGLTQVDDRGPVPRSVRTWAWFTRE